MEDYAIAVLFSGLTLAALAWLWLLVRAFKQNAGWGIISVILPPLALVFALRHAQRAIGPLVLFVLGSVVTAAPISYSLLGPSDLHATRTVTPGTEGSLIGENHSGKRRCSRMDGRQSVLHAARRRRAGYARLDLAAGARISRASEVGVGQLSYSRRLD